MTTSWLDELAARRRFGMKPGLARIARLCERLGHPERRLGRIVHIAGTNGKGAVAAILDAALRATGARVARYTSPHLVQINERFALNAEPMPDAALEAAATRVAIAVRQDPDLAELTFFEALTAVGFVVFSETAPDWTILETGLGGRLDATNVCLPVLAVITKIGLDHCDWLGETVEKIAGEKAGIVKPGIPVVLGRNDPGVRAVVADAARALGAPFAYAPDLADESEIPADFPLAGAFNRENAVTALAALKILESRSGDALLASRLSLSSVVWPGRFQRIGDILVDGAHNPPAAQALAVALAETPEIRAGRRFVLVAGFCGDKDVDTVLRTLAPFVASAVAVMTSNPRSLAADETAARLRRAGLAAQSASSLDEALALARATGAPILVAGSLFLVGDVLRHLHALPWKTDRRDPSCLLRRDAAEKSHRHRSCGRHDIICGMDSAKSKIDVKYVSDLARLELTDAERATFQPQLESIVGYVEKISAVDVEGVEPMMHGRRLVNAFREDEVKPSLATETALANAPKRVGDEFLLPKIVEGAES